MKVYEIPYTRYTIEEGRAAFAKFEKAFTAANTVEEALCAREALLDDFTEYYTSASLANCRFTLNTADPFYSAEVEYYDEVSPLFEELSVSYADLLLSSPLRPELEKHINARITVIDWADDLNIIHVVSLVQCTGDNGNDIGTDIIAGTFKECDVMGKRFKICFPAVNVMGKTDHVTAFFLPVDLFQTVQRNDFRTDDIPQHTAGADTWQLIFITDQTDLFDPF